MNKLTNYLPKLDFMTSCCQIKEAAIKSELSKKIFKIALPVFITAGCALQRENLTLLISRTFKVFCGHEGWVTPILMISTYLALKYLISLNQKPDDPKFSNTSRTTTWLKEIPKNFVIGIGKLPHSLMISIGTIIIADLIFKSLSINTSNSDFEMKIKQVSMFDATVKGPFLEELFFREFVQGSLISTMKLINLVGFRMKKNVIIREESIHTFSRIFSAAIFGLVHSNQNLNQAAAAGVSSYYCETLLYEKNGLFASFGLHFANNFFSFSLTKALSKP